MKVTEVDVLVVGAGPAGVMASAWMARAGIKTIMVDQKPAHTGKGHADGLEARTFEILDSFGIGDSCWAKANRNFECCIWDRNPGGTIYRESIRANGIPGLSRYHEATLGQGQIEEDILSVIADSSVQVLRETSPVSMVVDPVLAGDSNAHCINVRLETRSANNTITHRNVKARYLLGCDGAHSWVRKQVGLKMEGVGIDESWGVIDCIPITNFPDIRKRCIIRSESGTMMIIPRERRVCRLYVELSSDDTQLYKTSKDSSIVVKTVRDIFGQYEFRANMIEWCTVYTAGHRVCPAMSVQDRIFLAGDAVHTHTAKAGKGMNLSMQDSYNLGWKLASVIRGVANPEILKTYHLERMQTSKRLVAFDKKLYSEISSRKQDLQSLRTLLREENTSQSGMAVVYPSSIITAPASTTIINGGKHLIYDNQIESQQLSFVDCLVVGGRLPSHTLTRQCDVRPMDLQQLLPATGQWHLLVFGGNISKPDQMFNLRKVAYEISKGRPCLSRMVNPLPGQHLLGTIKTYLIHSAPRLSIEQQELPELFLPFDDDYGYDYDRVYADSENVHTQSTCYQRFGIPQDGCMVLVRPDQHISFIGSLQDTNLLEAFVTNLVSLVSLNQLKLEYRHDHQRGYGTKML